MILGVVGALLEPAEIRNLKGNLWDEYRCWKTVGSEGAGDDRPARQRPSQRLFSGQERGPVIAREKERRHRQNERKAAASKRAIARQTIVSKARAAGLSDTQIDVLLGKADG